MANLITVQEFQETPAAEKGILIDVRTPGEYAAGHVPQAVNIPLQEVRAESIRARFGELPIHLICQGGSRSEQAAQLLERAGVPNVYSIDGGTAAYKKAGFPLETASAPVSAPTPGQKAALPVAAALPRVQTLSPKQEPLASPGSVSAVRQAPKTRPPDYLLFPDSLDKSKWIALRADQAAWRATHPQPASVAVVHFDEPDADGWYANGKGVLSRPERLAPLEGFSGNRAHVASRSQDLGARSLEAVL